MKELNALLGQLCFLELDSLKDTRDTANEETGPTSAQGQNIVKCSTRERTLEER
jgi:hypothetical protein